MKLFIFGNGFDRAHNLPTKYYQFREWLKKSVYLSPKYRLSLKRIMNGTCLLTVKMV